MTRDDIIHMAREAQEISFGAGSNTWVFSTEGVERFATLVAAAERERWGKFCSELAGAYFLESQNERGKAALEMANLICEDAILGGDEEDATTHNRMA